MKKILSLLSLTLTLQYGWSQINEKDTIVTTITASNASIRLQADVLPDMINMQWSKGPDDFTGYFELYRSADGIAFHLIRQFHPSGFNAQQRYYQLSDEDPLRGKNFYRLIGYDQQTGTKRSVDLVAEFKNQSRKLLPTIVSRGTQLNIVNYDGARMELRVTNSAGTPVFQRVVTSSVIDVPAHLAKGMYVYQLADRRTQLLASGKFILH